MDYQYGMQLDIARVISRSEIANACKLVTALMTYEDSQGVCHTLRSVMGNGLPGLECRLRPASVTASPSVALDSRATLSLRWRSGSIGFSQRWTGPGAPASQAMPSFTFSMFTPIASHEFNESEH